MDLFPHGGRGEDPVVETPSLLTGLAVSVPEAVAERETFLFVGEWRAHYILYTRTLIPIMGHSMSSVHTLLTLIPHFYLRILRKVMF